VDAAFEGVPAAVGVGVGGFGLGEEVAEVEEVLLVAAALREAIAGPFVDEFVRGYGGRSMGEGAGLRDGVESAIFVKTFTIPAVCEPREKMSLQPIIRVACEDLHKKKCAGHPGRVAATVKS
jgi:hypothetical protein